MEKSSLLLLIPGFPLLGALFNLLIGRKAPRWVVHFVAVAAVATSFGVVLTQVFGPLWHQYVSHQFYPLAEPVAGSDALYQHVYRWIEVGDFKVDLAFRLDTLAAVMCLVVTGVGTLIHIYSTGYMADEPRYGAYFGYLNLFTGAMLILVLGANMPVMFIGWEGVGVCSYLLIGFWFTNEAYATAGRKAFVVNRIGDFAFLLGMFLLFYSVRSLDFQDLRAEHAQEMYRHTLWGGERMAAAAGILLFIGAAGKSAQIPLYVWLPDAMAGPTPVSALIHAATMVTAGVYMVARTSFLFSQSTTAMAVVATVGMLTALLAAFYAFAQTDLKKVLAYSTVSQLGFMFVGVGTGNWVPAIFHVATHAFFKAGLFLGAGSVMHAMSGSGDITKMGGLKKKLPITHATFLIYCLAIAGFPLLSGWFSKDAILAGAWGVEPQGWPRWYGNFLWLGLTVAAFGTAVYMWRLYFLVFAGECRADAETQAHIHESPPSMTIPLVTLAGFAVVAGLLGIPHVLHLGGWNEMLDQWLEPSVAPSFMHHLSALRIAQLLFIATLVGLAGIFVAWKLYGDGPSKKVEEWTAGPLKDAYRASLNKLWVDELYDIVIVRPFRWVANGLFQFVDRFLIDTVLVEGSARVIGLFGRLARWVQNGQVQRYMVGLILGGALIFFVTSRSANPGIKVEKVPQGLELKAYAGSGLAGEKSKLRWDLTGDGDWDLKPEAEERLRREDTDDLNSNWHGLVAAMQNGHVIVEIDGTEHDLASWKPDEVSAYLRELSPGRLEHLIDTRSPKDARERYDAYKAAVTIKPEDYVSDPTLVRRAGEVGPLVRLEITDPIDGSKRVVSTEIGGH